MSQCEGCNAHKDTWNTSYHLLEKEIQTTTGLTDRELKIQTAKIFFSRYEVEKRLMSHEINGTQQYEGIEFNINEKGEIYYPLYGDQTVNDLNERARDYNTHGQYLPEEHKASLLLQEAIVNGASFAATSYKNENGQRDVHVFTYDKEAKIGKSHIINTASNGVVSDYEGIRQKMKHMFPHAKEMHPSDGVSVLTDKQLSYKQINTIVSQIDSHSNRNQYDGIHGTNYSVDYGFVKNIGLTTDSTARRLKEEMITTYIGLHQYIEGKTRKKKHKSEFKGSLNTEKTAFLQFKRKEKQERMDLKKRSLLQSILLQKKTVDTKKYAMKLSVATNIGIGGALLHLKEIAGMPHQKITKKDKIRIRKEMRKMGKKEKKQLQNTERKKHIAEKNTQSVCMDTRIQKDKLKKKVLFHKTLKHIRLEKNIQKKIEKSEKRNVQVPAKENKIYELVQMFKKLTYKYERLHKKQENRIMKKEIKKQISKEIKNTKPKEMLKKDCISGFTQALILFLLFSHNEPRPKEIVPKNIGVSNQIKNTEVIKPEYSETPWVLLAIIWYMTMIREHGVIGAQKQRTKKKKQTKRSGVLFDRSQGQFSRTFGFFML